MIAIITTHDLAASDGSLMRIYEFDRNSDSPGPARLMITCNILTTNHPLHKPGKTRGPQEGWQ